MFRKLNNKITNYRLLEAVTAQTQVGVKQESSSGGRRNFLYKSLLKIYNWVSTKCKVDQTLGENKKLSDIYKEKAIKSVNFKAFVNTYSSIFYKFTSSPLPLPHVLNVPTPLIKKLHWN